jgi:hypothetical protein
LALRPFASHSSRNVIAAKRSRGEPLAGSLLGLLPFAIQTGAHIAWLAASPQILHGHLVPFAIYWGVAFAYQVGLLITAHTTKGPFPYWNGLMVWSAVCALDANADRLLGRPGLVHADEGRALALVYVSIVLAIAVYSFFVWDVVGEVRPRARGGRRPRSSVDFVAAQICSYLDMNCESLVWAPSGSANAHICSQASRSSTRARSRLRWSQRRSSRRASRAQRGQRGREGGRAVKARLAKRECRLEIVYIEGHRHAREGRMYLYAVCASSSRRNVPEERTTR